MFRLRLLCTHARTQQASTLEDLVIPIRGIDTLRSTIVKAARLAASDPKTEWHKDTWNVAVFGHGNQTIDFSKITQPWLCEVVKYWVSEEMPRRRGKAVGSVMQGVASITRLSESLHRTDDRGDIPARLGREDAICFLSRLAYLTSIGKITLYMRINNCRNVKRVINGLRNRASGCPATSPERCRRSSPSSPRTSPAQRATTSPAGPCPTASFRSSARPCRNWTPTPALHSASPPSS
ncbi:hypothetical protein ACWEF9_27685 [Streptomyces sp. NPDC004980]